jgi:uncharacterized membrane protein YheB (UPF0754 family)
VHGFIAGIGSKPMIHSLIFYIWEVWFMNISSKDFGMLSIIFGLASIAFSIYNSNKLKETAAKIDVNVDAIANTTAEDIQKSAIDTAINKAVDREVQNAISDTAKRVREDIRSEIKAEVKKEVDKQYKEISEEVSEKISDQVANIDIASLKERVTKKAEDKVIKKLDGCLDGAIGMFNGKLNEWTKMYQGAANVFNSFARPDRPSYGRYD